MMRKIILLVISLIFAQAGYAQFHQDVLVGEQGTQLLDDLEDDFKPSSVLSYGAARQKMFGLVDNINDTIYCVYTHDKIYLNHNSNDPKGDAYAKGFNTEHTFPQSQGATGQAKSNVHHLFPTRIDVNGDRGHLPFRDINDNATDNWYYLDYEGHSVPNTNIDEYSELDINDYFEPREAHKGNVARAMMYFYTMYHGQADGQYFQGMIPTLCAWHYQDAVDEQEWDRTWAIAEFQSNKPNPFVLDCTLAERSYCSDMGYTCIVGTEETEPMVELFDSRPNPAHLAVKIRFTLESAFAKGDIVVYDMLGRQVATKKMVGLVAGPNEQNIDVSSWNSGFYTYVVKVAGGIASGKLIVY